MSYPPGPPDPNDPWATPTGDQPTQPPQPPQPSYPPQQPYGQPAYGYGQPGYGQPYGYGSARPTNGKATAALWTGIGSLVLTVCCGLGIVGLLPIVLGVKARSEIRASGGQQDGEGMALAGIITGACALVLSLVFIALIIVVIASGDANFEGSTGV
jgi:hypothetical protein